MMKRLLPTLSLAFSLTFVAVAATARTPEWRSQRHELRFSAGAWPLHVDEPDYSYGDWEGFRTPETFASTLHYRGATYTSGAYTLAYDYRFSRLFDIGGALSYSRIYHREYSNLNNARLRTCATDYLSFIPVLRCTWVQKEYVRAYSSVGFGVTIAARDTRGRERVQPGIQCTFVGLAIGRRLFGFAELGCGTHGVVTAGFGYRFLTKNE